jgi:cytochrome P450
MANGPDALPRGPTIPAIAQTAAWWLRPFDFLDRCAAEYGDTFRLRFLNLGNLVMVSAPEHIRQVFSAPPDVLLAGEGNKILEAVVGSNSMLLLDGPDHLRHRRLLMPPFMGERMNAYGRIIQECTLATLRSIPTDREIALHPSMQAITLQVILKAIFGLESVRAESEPAATLIESFRESPSFLALLPALQIDVPPFPFHRLKTQMAGVNRVIYALLEDRRKSRDLSTRADILSLLLGARDEAGQPMTDIELRDELMTLVAAGHETTATALAWTFQRLASEPEVLRKVVAEVSEAKTSMDGPAAFAKLEYLDAVIKEVLRLRPIIPIVARIVRAPYEIAGATLPVGTMLAPCIYLAHRRAETYPDPLRFDPDRWIGKKPDPNAWLPFGGGGRRCIGMGFALYEMKIILATILANVSLRTTSGKPERPVRRSVTLAPAKGARVVLSKLAA